MGVSDKFKHIGNHYNIRTIFKTKHKLRSSLMKTRPERDPQQMARCVYSIPCECGRSYIGETGSPLAVRLCEHKHNLKEGLLEKSKLAQHVKSTSALWNFVKENNLRKSLSSEQTSRTTTNNASLNRRDTTLF
jgi:predicted GIY-YIG superfamily endonuclease